MTNEVQVAETTMEAAPVVEETVTTVTRVINGQQIAIIAGSALAGIGAYLLVTKVIVPKVSGAIDNHKANKEKVVIER